jgi:hypothetical protein
VRRQRHLIALTTLIILISCQEQDTIDLSTLSERERIGVKSLLWLRQANALQDVQSALKKNDKRLLVMAGRIPHIPGVEEKLSTKAKKKCGISIIKGSTDMVLGDTHLKLLQAASKYAFQYNRNMLQYCFNNP